MRLRNSPELVLLKLGGSVITDKGLRLTAREKVIGRLAGEIANAKSNKDFRLILVNGAGSFGHAPVEEYGLKEGMDDEKKKLGFTLVHKYVENLNRILWDRLTERGVISIPIHPASFVVQDDWKIVKFDTDVIEGMVERGITPLLYGDMVLDLSQGCSIISGDDIIPYLARKLGATRILMGSNTDGIFDMDPKIYPESKLIPEINKRNLGQVLKGLTGSTKTDVTGGMREKVSKLVSSVRGTECLIYNAEKEGLTEKVLLGGKTGTIISF